MDAYIVTKDPEFLDAVKDIIKYLTSAPICRPEGGFYASVNSDSLPAPVLTRPQSSGAAVAPTPVRKSASQTSPIAIPNASHSNAAVGVNPLPLGQPLVDPNTPREGAYYVWTYKELLSVLGPTVGPLVARYYSCSALGNIPVEFDPEDELVNQNVLSVSSSPADSLTSLAREAGLSGGAEEAKHVLMKARQKLRAHREATRTKPALDDKIVLSWNGLTIGALARAGYILRFIPEVDTEKAEDVDSPFESNLAAAEAAAQAAENAMQFVKKEMYDAETGRLTRIWRQGELVSKGLAFADDYAFLISGLVDVYEATGDSGVLEWAEALQSKQTFTQIY
jgi:uncharacterized protein YyaL (SSP411 family)